MPVDIRGLPDMLHPLPPRGGARVGGSSELHALVAAELEGSVTNARLRSLTTFSSCGDDQAPSAALSLSILRSLRVRGAAS